MKKRTVWAAGVIAALMAVGAYAASPLLAVRGLQTAARDGDADKLQRLVDFPAVRESLKGQLNALIIESMRSDPELRDNPFAGFAAVLAPAIVNQAVDGYVTPDGLARMLQAKPPEPTMLSTAEAPPPPGEAGVRAGKAVIKHGYRGLDTYTVTSTGADKPGAQFNFVLHRQGLFGWKLARIELPKSLRKPTAAPISPPVQTSTLPSETPETLLQRWAQENGDCRGGAGGEAATERACEARSVTDAALEQAGWCYGENAAYGYQMEWRRCGDPKFASIADAEASADREREEQ